MQLNQSFCWSCKILSFSNIVADEKKERKEVCQFALLILHVENESRLINGNQYFFKHSVSRSHKFHIMSINNQFFCRRSTALN